MKDLFGVSCGNWQGRGLALTSEGRDIRGRSGRVQWEARATHSWCVDLKVMVDISRDWDWNVLERVVTVWSVLLVAAAVLLRLVEQELLL